MVVWQEIAILQQALSHLNGSGEVAGKRISGLSCTNQGWILIRPIEYKIYLASYSLTLTTQLGVFEFKKCQYWKKSLGTRAYIL